MKLMRAAGALFVALLASDLVFQVLRLVLFALGVLALFNAGFFAALGL